MSFFRLSRSLTTSNVCLREHVIQAARFHAAAIARDASNPSMTQLDGRHESPDAKPSKPSRKRKRKADVEPQAETDLTEHKVGGPDLSEVLMNLQRPARHLLSLEDLEKDLKDELESYETFKANRQSSISKYKAMHYDPLLDVLNRRFTRDQLEKFVIQAKLAPKRNSPKGTFAESILRFWGLPDPKKLMEEETFRTKMVEEVIELSAPYLFHIIGKDGEGLRKLTESFDIAVNFVRNPVGLWVRGSQESIDNVRKVIARIKDEVYSKTFYLPTGQRLPHDITRKLSTLSNTFIMNKERSGELCIYARAEQDMQQAYRIAVRLTADFTPVRLFCLRPKDPSMAGLPMAVRPMYAMFPFFTRVVPWDVAGGFTRLRRIGDWLGLDLRDDIKGESGLTGAEGQILSVTGLNVNSLEDKAAAYFPPLRETEYTHRSITASPGHVVFSAQESGKLGGLPTTATRDSANSSHEAVLAWIAGNPSPHFFPGLPPELADAQPSTRRQTLRLLYQARTPDHYNTMRIDIPYLRAAPFVEFEFPLRRSTDDSPVAMEPVRKSGMLMETNLMQPERFMDLNFVARDYKLLSSDETPAEIVEFGKDLEGNSGSLRPPLLFTWQGQEYFLSHHESVYETDETLSSPHLRVLRQSKVDLELPIASERTPACIIQLDEDTTEGWIQFYAQCDRLTGKGYTPLPQTGLMSLESLSAFGERTA